jgi:hypothetical protein
MMRLSFLIVGRSSPAAALPIGEVAGRVSGCAGCAVVSVAGSATGVGVGFGFDGRGMRGSCAEVTCKLKSATIKNAKVIKPKVSEELFLIFNLSFSLRSQRRRGLNKSGKLFHQRALRPTKRARAA